MGKEVVFYEEENNFVVKLPVIRAKTIRYERIKHL